MTNTGRGLANSRVKLRQRPRAAKPSTELVRDGPDDVGAYARSQSLGVERRVADSRHDARGARADPSRSGCSRHFRVAEVTYRRHRTVAGYAGEQTGVHEHVLDVLVPGHQVVRPTRYLAYRLLTAEAVEQRSRGTPTSATSGYYGPPARSPGVVIRGRPAAACRVCEVGAHARIGGRAAGPLDPHETHHHRLKEQAELEPGEGLAHTGMRP